MKGGNNVLFSALRKAGLVKRKSYFKEKHSSYFDASIFKSNFIYLNGYWQNELYFSNIRIDKKNNNRPNSPTILNIEMFYNNSLNLSGNPVVLNFRRSNVKILISLDSEITKQIMNSPIDLDSPFLKEMEKDKRVLIKTSPPNNNKIFPIVLNRPSRGPFIFLVDLVIFFSLF